MTAPQSADPDTTHRDASHVKRYNRIKLVVSLAGAALSFLFTVGLLAAGYTVAIEQFARSLTEQPYVALLIFAAALGVISGVISFPFSFYSGFILEHGSNFPIKHSSSGYGNM